MIYSFVNLSDAANAPACDRNALVPHLTGLNLHTSGRIAIGGKNPGSAYVRLIGAHELVIRLVDLNLTDILGILKQL